MKNVTVTPEQFEKAVHKALAEYGDDVTELLEKETKSMARKAAKELKHQAPGGEYSAGWTHKAKKGGTYKMSDTVYNRIYQLTHLLENPHATGPKRGGHYPKNKDYTGQIAAVEEKYTEQFMEEVMSKL